MGGFTGRNSLGLRLETTARHFTTSLELAALGGFPGPLIKWMLQSVGAAGVAATARASFYVYNEESDIDALVAGLRRAGELFGVG